MALTITNQFLLANIGPLDYSMSNYYISGSSVVIETPTQYCARIPKSIRKQGVNILFLSPTGVYSISNFINSQSGFTPQYYMFSGGINASNLIISNPIQSNGSIKNMVSMTQAEYDALVVKDPYTIYFIKTI